MATTQSLMHRLSKAKTQLVMKHCFIGSIALGMDTKLDDTLNPATAATDGKQVLYHPDYVAARTDQEMIWVTAHECFHPMLEDNFRRGNRDPKLWNIAADIRINHLLEEDKIGKRPPNVWFEPDIYAQGKGRVELIYDIVKQDADNNGPLSQKYDLSSANADNCTDFKETATEGAEEARQMWKAKVAEAAQLARLSGTISDGMKRFINEVLFPKVPWQDVMHRFVERTRDDSRSYRRLNRRFMCHDMVVPSANGESLGEIVFAIDCSGSVGPRELALFASEGQKLKDSCDPRSMHVVYFDSEVCHYDEFGRDDPLVIAPHGGGGTAFSPIFKYIDKKGIEPVAVVVLTDLYCSDYGPEPDYPVLWVATEDSRYVSKVPFGEVVLM